MARATKSSSYSKKAQVSAFTGYVVAGAGALLGAVLLVISLFEPNAFGGLRSGANDLVSPAGRGGAVARTSGQSVFESISGYYRAGSKNAALREEMEVARIRLAEAEALKRENQRLKAVLGLSDSAEDPPVTRGRLIGSTSTSARRLAYLSVGRRHGVRPGMPVRSPRGLVGRVLDAGSLSARVLLLTDNESVVPVRLATGDVVAFAEGRSDGTLRIRLVNLGINPLKKGDVFVTSGAGGLYRPGIAVAVATEINRDGAIGRLLSDPAGTDYVVVDPIWQPQAQQVVPQQAPPPEPAEDAQTPAPSEPAAAD